MRSSSTDHDDGRWWSIHSVRRKSLLEFNAVIFNQTSNEYIKNIRTSTAQANKYIKNMGKDIETGFDVQASGHKKEVAYDSHMP